jgi:hypothetical protein
MAFELEIITIILGVFYGYLKPGTEDRKAMIKKGVLIGIILGIILIGLSILFGAGLLPGGIVGAVLFLYVIVFAALFIIGTFIGDWLEGKSKAA